MQETRSRTIEIICYFLLTWAKTYSQIFLILDLSFRYLPRLSGTSILLLQGLNIYLDSRPLAIVFSYTVTWNNNKQEQKRNKERKKKNNDKIHNIMWISSLDVCLNIKLGNNRKLDFLVMWKISVSMSESLYIV